MCLLIFSFFLSSEFKSHLSKVFYGSLKMSDLGQRQFFVKLSRYNHPLSRHSGNSVPPMWFPCMHWIKYHDGYKRRMAGIAVFLLEQFGCKQLLSACGQASTMSLRYVVGSGEWWEGTSGKMYLKIQSSWVQVMLTWTYIMSFNKFCRIHTSFSISLMWQFVTDYFMLIVEFGKLILK